MQFLDELLERDLVNGDEADFLKETDVDDYESLWVLMRTYPSLFGSKFDNAARLSTVAMNHAGGAALSAAAAVSPNRAHGARIQGKGGLMRAGGANGAKQVLAGRKAIDNRARMGPWPIKDQGRRVTCVAFATVAALEHKRGPHPGPLDLAEQYLYWAAKQSHHDKDKTVEGSTLICAQDALEKSGVCEETLWRYDPNLDPQNVTHASKHHPSSGAHADASTRKCPCNDYESTMVGKAARLYDVLASGRVAAMTFGVYKDSASATDHNCNTLTAERSGRILLPPKGAVATMGHAVCVVAFVPSPTATAGGGWFVFRNSWGTGWARNGSLVAGAPGHGYLSASYVEAYGGELLAL